MEEDGSSSRVRHSHSTTYMNYHSSASVERRSGKVTSVASGRLDYYTVSVGRKEGGITSIRTPGHHGVESRTTADPEAYSGITHRTVRRTHDPETDVGRRIAAADEADSGTAGSVEYHSSRITATVECSGAY